jgi:superfamily II DNA or RNA helicase
MIELRKYQNESISALRKNILNGIKKSILCAPTGSGKTIMFTYMISRAVDKGKKCLIVTDRTELLTQAGGTLENFNIRPIEIKPNKKLNSLNGVIYVGMAQTLKRRIKDQMYIDFLAGLDLIIFDEAHKQEFNDLMPYITEKTIVIGATATPHREGNQISLHEFYKDIVEVTTISELIELGFLAKPHTYGVKVDLSKVKTKGGDYDQDQVAKVYDEVKMYHGVYENYTRLTPNKKGIIFASNIASSIQLVTDFKSRGLPIEHIDGNTPTGERKRILKWFKDTPNALISNVGILNAGFDEPNLEVVILYRATKSISLFLQMCGRGSRTTETKKDFTILDFGNNIQRHGFWEQTRQWNLIKKKKKEGVAPVKDCPSCGAILPVSIMTCTECGYIFQKTEKEEEEDLIVELSKLSYQQIKDEILTADFKKLEQIALAKGYKKTWIYYHLKTELDLINYAKYKGYSNGWVQYQLQLREQNQVLSLSKIRQENESRK